MSKTKASLDKFKDGNRNARVGYTRDGHVRNDHVHVIAFELPADVPRGDEKEPEREREGLQKSN